MNPPKPETVADVGLTARRVVSGKVFSRLTTITVIGKASGHPVWLCRCICGKATKVREGNLIHGNVQSCGCLRSERSGQRFLRHGLTNTPEHATWAAMVQRCSDRNCKSYKNYGGRGIKVCLRWLESFENFLADMGSRPAGMTIERVDNNGNYEPSNCRWATPEEQSRNRRDSVRITLNGETRCLSEWDRLLGFGRGTVFARLKRGWKPEEAVSRTARIHLKTLRRGSRNA